MSEKKETGGMHPQPLSAAPYLARIARGDFQLVMQGQEREVITRLDVTNRAALDLGDRGLMDASPVCHFDLREAVGADALEELLWCLGYSH